MDIEPSNNKFGLPKPDFQNVPKKRSVWPILSAIVVLASILAIGQIAYHLYFKKTYKPNSKPSSQVTEQNNSNIVPKTSRKLTPPVTKTTNEEVGTDVNVEVNEAVTGNETFEHKKNTKKTENIKAVQKQLEEGKKNPKPLVKPGTYQELHEPQGLYHLVVVSHLNKAAAIKEVKRLTRKNLGVYLIIPRKGEKYYRVTIAHSKTEFEANEKLKQLKSTYKNSFVLKY